MDLILGEEGDDALYGDGGGFNQVVPGPGDDFVDAGRAGGDEVIYLDASGGIDGNLETGVVTGQGTDRGRQHRVADRLEHDDTLVGFLDGHDVLFGAGGNDSLDSNGTAGPDVADFMAGARGTTCSPEAPGDTRSSWSGR